MSTIVTRAGKGSPLTHTEVDSNFTNLNTDKAESTNPTLSGNVSTTGLNFDSNTFVIDATNNRVGVGVASPSFSLDVSSSGTSLARFTGAQYSQIRHSDGTRVLYTQVYDNAAIFGTESSTPLLLVTGGSERMRITSTGSVGIGTTSDLGKLGVMASTNGDTIAQFRCSGTGTQRALLVSVDNSTGVVKLDASGAAAGSMAFAYGGTEAMRINTSGNVGIGTSSISSTYTPRLHIESAASDGTGGLLIGSYLPTLTLFDYSGGAGASQIQQDGTNFLIKNGGSTRVTLDSSGNLGLGVTPSAWSSGKAFEIGNVGDGLSINYGYGLVLNRNSYYNAGFKYSSSDYASQYRQSGGQHQWMVAPSGTAGNAITFTQAMTLDASGNLGVGVTSPAARMAIASTADTGELRVQGSGTNTWYAGIYKNNTTGEFRLTQKDGGVGMTFYTNDPSTEKMRLDTSGNLGIGTTSPSAKLTVSSGSIRLSDGYEIGWGDNSSYIVGNGTSDTLQFITAAAERMRIDSSGNLLVGKTASSSYPVQAKGGGLDGSTTVSVNSGVTTTIYTSPQTVTAMFCVVFGDNGSVGFCDLIIFLPSVTPTVVSSNSIYGSPAARTYSVASTTQLRVNVANNLSVRVAVLGTCSV